MTALHRALAAVQAAKRPRKRQQVEHGFQTTVVDLLEVILPDNAVVTSIDHAAAASKATGALRKRRGVKPGIPDIWIVWSPDPDTQRVVLVLLETKTKTGPLSVEQQVWRDTLIALGVHWASPRSLEEAIAAVSAAGIPLRKHSL